MTLRDMRTGTLFVAVLMAGAGLPACTGDDAPISDEAPGEPPDKADSAYTVSGARAWYLVGNGLTEGNDRLELAIKGPSSTSVVDLWLDGQFKKRATRTSSGWSF